MMDWLGREGGGATELCVEGGDWRPRNDGETSGMCIQTKSKKHHKRQNKTKQTRTDQLVSCLLLFCRRVFSTAPCCCFPSGPVLSALKTISKFCCLSLMWSRRGKSAREKGGRRRRRRRQPYSRSCVCLACLSLALALVSPLSRPCPSAVCFCRCVCPIQILPAYVPT